MVDLQRTRATDAEVVAHDVSTDAFDILEGENPNVEGWTAFNNTDQTVYIKFGGDASSDEFTFLLNPGQFYETPALETYIGQVSAICGSTGSGKLMVTKKLR